MLVSVFVFDLDPDTSRIASDPLYFLLHHHCLDAVSAAFLGCCLKVDRTRGCVHQRYNAKKARDAECAAGNKSDGPEKAESERRDGTKHHETISFHTRTAFQVAFHVAFRI